MKQSRKILLLAATLVMLSAGSSTPGYVETVFGDPEAPYGHYGNAFSDRHRAVRSCEKGLIELHYGECQEELTSSQKVLESYNQRNPGPLESWDEFQLKRARELQRDIGILNAFCYRAKTQLDYLAANPDKHC